MKLKYMFKSFEHFSFSFLIQNFGLQEYLSENQTKTPDQTASEEASTVGVFHGLYCLSRPLWCTKIYHPGPNVALMGPG